MASQVEAIAGAKRDRNFALSVMGKYLRTADTASLSEAYDVYVQKYLLKVSLPTVEGLRAVLEELASRNPKARRPTRKNSSTIPSCASYSRAALSTRCTDKTIVFPLRPSRLRRLWLNRPNKACYKRFN